MKKPIKGKNYNEVIDKKLVDEKIYYLMVRGRSRKWVDFQDLEDYLDLVIEYQSKNKEQKQVEICNNDQQEVVTQQHKQHIEVDQNSQKITKLRKQLKKKKIDAKQIENMIFLNKIEGQLFFKVYFSNGVTKNLTNTYLRTNYPLILIDFYQNNIQISGKSNQTQVQT